MATRSKSSRRWLEEHRNDPYVKQAKKDGLRSRAAFKLKEIQEKHQLIKPGMWVLELGAAPGGWTEEVAQWVGEKGHVFAIDLLPMDPIYNVTIQQGDIQDQDTFADLQKRIGEHGVDLVLSDMAPNMSGVPTVDAARSAGLLEIAEDTAAELLKTGGTFCTKAFHGEGFDAMVKTLRTKYAKVSVYKPQASRSRSKEVYIIAKEKRG
jgi:23S rRNA (uridine2552-2'-O)-methyltransferase